LEEDDRTSSIPTLRVSDYFLYPELRSLFLWQRASNFSDNLRHVVVVAKPTAFHTCIEVCNALLAKVLVWGICSVRLAASLLSD
jgi:hypothetical protein